MLYMGTLGNRPDLLSSSYVGRYYGSDTQRMRFRQKH